MLIRFLCNVAEVPAPQQSAGYFKINLILIDNIEVILYSNGYRYPITFRTGTQNVWHRTFLVCVRQINFNYSVFLGGTFALQQTAFKERYFKLLGNLLFCLRADGGEVLSLIVLETCTVQREDKVPVRLVVVLRNRFNLMRIRTIVADPG
jgi:hypothetical protein